MHKCRRWRQRTSKHWCFLNLLLSQTWTTGIHRALQHTMPVPRMARKVPIRPEVIPKMRKARLWIWMSKYELWLDGYNGLKNWSIQRVWSQPLFNYSINQKFCVLFNAYKIWNRASQLFSWRSRPDPRLCMLCWSIINFYRTRERCALNIKFYIIIKTLVV